MIHGITARGIAVRRVTASCHPGRLFLINPNRSFNLKKGREELKKGREGRQKSAAERRVNEEGDRVNVLKNRRRGERQDSVTETILAERERHAERLEKDDAGLSKNADEQVVVVVVVTPPSCWPSHALPPPPLNPVNQLQL
jgi:hypothetical protein